MEVRPLGVPHLSQVLRKVGLRRPPAAPASSNSCAPSASTNRPCSDSPTNSAADSASASASPAPSRCGPGSSWPTNLSPPSTSAWARKSSTFSPTAARLRTDLSLHFALHAGRTLSLDPHRRDVSRQDRGKLAAPSRSPNARITPTREACWKPRPKWRSRNFMCGQLRSAGPSNRAPIPRLCRRRVPARIRSASHRRPKHGCCSAPPMSRTRRHAESAPLSEGARIVNTFIAPSKTFTDLRRSAAWWAPFLLMVIVSTFLVYSVGRRSVP